jgi:hypothetical protein
MNRPTDYPKSRP